MKTMDEAEAAQLVASMHPFAYVFSFIDGFGKESLNACINACIVRRTALDTTERKMNKRFGV